MRISICIPHKDRETDLIDGIYSVITQNPDLELAFSIADDRSRPPLSHECFDGFVGEMIRINWLMGTPEPLNPCVPINLAVERAIKFQQPDLIVLTNPEIIHETDTLTSMVQIFKHYDEPETYITASCYDERGQIAGPEVDYSKAGRLPVPDGAHFHFLAMFTPALWQAAGGFDEDYRNGQGCDDNDWLWRCANAGANFVCVDEPVRHKKSDTKWNLPHNRDLFFEKWPDLKP